MESYTLSPPPELLPSRVTPIRIRRVRHSPAISAVAFRAHTWRLASEQEIVDSRVGNGDEEPILHYRRGFRSRATRVGRRFPVNSSAGAGGGRRAVSDAEMVEPRPTALPELHPWGGYSTLITYRFRPYQTITAFPSWEACFSRLPWRCPRPAWPLARRNEDWWPPGAGSPGHSSSKLINLESMQRGLRSSQQKGSPWPISRTKIRHFTRSIDVTCSSLSGPEGARRRGGCTFNSQTGGTMSGRGRWSGMSPTEKVCGKVSRSTFWTDRPRRGGSSRQWPIRIKCELDVMTTWAR